MRGGAAALLALGGAGLCAGLPLSPCDWAPPAIQSAISLMKSKGNPLWSFDIDAAARDASPLLPRSADWDMVIDARSPCEFAKDHIPGAVNLAVLSDEERAEVGTLYQRSAFEGKKVGARYVARNIAKNLCDPRLMAMPQDARLLVYCYRGGDRSGSLGVTLSRVGWKVCVLKGGYKGYRKGVRELLREKVPRLRVVLVGGKTGSAKGKLLDCLDAIGCQTIDLEGLANHRGSVLGEVPFEAQPTQKHFETLLAARVAALDEGRSVFVEAESSRIGRVALPEQLFSKMKGAPMVTVELPLAERVRWIREGYRHFETTHVDALKRKLEFCVPTCGRKTVDGWRDLADRGEWDAFVASMLEQHYDRAYAKAFRRDRGDLADDVTLSVASTDDQSYQEAARTVAARFP